MRQFCRLLQRAAIATKPKVMVPTPVAGTSVEESLVTNEVLSLVNDQITKDTCGRLFAVVHLCGQQFKVTQEDLVMLHYNRPMNVGDEINIEKVLMVGSKDFSIVGTPLLPRKLVRVEATVVEKTLSFVEPHFHFVRRHNIRFLLLERHELNLIRINRVQLLASLSETCPEAKALDQSSNSLEEENTIPSEATNSEREREKHIETRE